MKGAFGMDHVLNHARSAMDATRGRLNTSAFKMRLVLAFPLLHFANTKIVVARPGMKG